MSWPCVGDCTLFSIYHLLLDHAACVDAIFFAQAPGSQQQQEARKAEGFCPMGQCSEVGFPISWEMHAERFREVPKCTQVLVSPFVTSQNDFAKDARKGLAPVI